MLHKWEDEVQDIRAPPSISKDVKEDFFFLRWSLVTREKWIVDFGHFFKNGSMLILKNL